MTTDRWTRDLVVALRLRRVRGDVIGDAVEVVESHCRETGESPASAFGPVEEYAAALVAALPARSLVPATPAWSTVALAVTTSLGAFLVLEGCFALMAAEPASVPWSLVLVVALTGAAALVVARWFDRLVERPWSMGALIFATLGASVGLIALLDGASVSLPAWVVLVVGVAVLALAGVVLARSRALAADPVLAPALDRAG